MTTENTTFTLDTELKAIWVELWQFARDSISFGESDIDFDDFFKRGVKLFDLKIKPEEE